MDVRFKNDSVFTISGPSSSGKTVFVQRLIKHRKLLFHKNIARVHWFYGEIAPSNLDPSIKKHKGLIDGWSDLIKPRDMVIIDDLFMESSNNKEMTNAFTRLAHHRPCTLIFITQNIFHKSADSKTRNLNTHYLVLMKNPRDATQISYISRQMYPENSNFLVSIFRNVTANKPYSYIILDFCQETPSVLRVRSDIFPNEPYATYINDLQTLKTKQYDS